MSHAIGGNPRIETAALTARAERLLKSIGRTVAEWRRRSRSRHELAGMGDLLLRDIGLSRVDAHQEVRKPFWQA